MLLLLRVTQLPAGLSIGYIYPARYNTTGMQTIIEHYFELSPQQAEQFAALEPLYRDWNTKINVISRKDIDAFYEHHVLHSLAIAKIIRFERGARILDLGTGGGFPGVPLAIMFPDTQFVLVDSVGKKLKVVDDVCRQLGITNIQTVHARAEDVSGVFDFVVSRAVTRLNTAWGWVADKISSTSRHELPNGLLYLKGGDIAEELPDGVDVRRWELSQWFDDQYFAEKALVLLSEKSA